MQGPSITFKINYIRYLSYITKAFAELKEKEASTHCKFRFLTVRNHEITKQRSPFEYA